MIIADVELSVLASVSKGYTAGQILETIEKVIEQKKLNKYGGNICKAEDFIQTLGMKTPIFFDEENKIKNWYALTPNGARRLLEIQQAFSTSGK